MKPVYCPRDINGFKEYLNSNKQQLHSCNTKKELLIVLRELRTTYYNNCTPIGYI